MVETVRREHRYRLSVTWTGNRGEGTRSYTAYSRDHEVSAEGKAALLGSSDPAFRGDPTRWSPEELLVAALSQCHMLWYLHLCSAAGIVVTAYEDSPEGVLDENRDGSGQFVRTILRPRITLADPGRAAQAAGLHSRAHELCFIARSVNFPVEVEITAPVAEASLGDPAT
ncbi:MAG: OsmC family protein [Candidatus Dormiibacterota bacterium]